LIGADLSGALVTNTSLADLDLTDVNLTGALLLNVNTTGVIWSNTTCVDGTNSDLNGGTCEGHN
jgi:uncharacterized protein YjbI with pentapeptide repeats